MGGATSARIWAITCSTVMPANWRLGVEQQPVAEHRLGELLDVVGHHVVAALAIAQVLAQRTNARQPRTDRPSLTLRAAGSPRPAG